MITHLDNADIRGLHAAALFASKDQTRPALANVAVIDTDLFIGCDSFAMGMIGREGEHPGDIIIRVQEVFKDQHEFLLLEASEVIKYAKATSKSTAVHSIDAGSDDWITMSDTQTRMVSRRSMADTPNYGNLTRNEEPAAMKGINMNLSYLAVLMAAFKVDGGKMMIGPGSSSATFWGGEGILKPGYWSVGRIVMLLMPMKAAVTWKGE